ncbi:MAG: EAL domain-containing protein [Candidatus Thiodiazotropha sp.]
MIAMAHKLGIKVIAEGVETESQMRLLKHSGCDYAQGYFYSKPVSAGEFEHYLPDAED